jgi:hypothetical protein
MRAPLQEHMQSRRRADVDSSRFGDSGRCSLPRVSEGKGWTGALKFYGSQLSHKLAHKLALYFAHIDFEGSKTPVLSCQVTISANRERYSALPGLLAPRGSK